MRNNFFTKQALPLPKGRNLRFARGHAYAASDTSECAPIRASHRNNSVASPNASFVALTAANRATSLVLRYP
jgi:hypothetical protein